MLSGSLLNETVVPDVGLPDHCKFTLAPWVTVILEEGCDILIESAVVVKLLSFP